MPTNDRPGEAALTIRLPADMRTALNAEAARHERSAAGQVRFLIAQSLDHGAEPPAADASDDDGRSLEAAA